MDIVYQQGQATASEVQAALADPPSYSAVRAKLRILEDKGYLAHDYDGPRYVYKPIVERASAERSALNHLLNTFFDNSVEKAVAALVKLREDNLSDDELVRLSDLIDNTRTEADS